ncbi:hypothetical protein IWQ57_006998, partial [Coemansia nantahalensis]
MSFFTQAGRPGGGASRQHSLRRPRDGGGGSGSGSERERGRASASRSWRQRPEERSARRSAAAGMMERVRTIVDNVAEALDGPSPTRRDRLVESWARIQEYYTPQRSDDLRQITVADTTIPHHLECMLRIIANEMVEDGGAADPAQPLEFGPCVEYLLQYHVLSDLVDLADRDTPRGVHMYVVRFFDLFIGCIPLGLLPESAIRLPLVAIMRQCLHIVQTSPAAPMAAPGRTARDVA